MGCLNETNLVVSVLCQGKYDYNSGGIFYGLILAPKVKYCLNLNKYGNIQQHMIFKGFNDSEQCLD